jgi:hypothetical protein
MTPASSSRGSPKTQVDTMPAAKFFAYAAEILKLQPPHLTDEPILAQMRRIGIERGKSFDIDKLDPPIKTALETAPKDALALMAWKVSRMARALNGWSMNTDTMGVYGNYCLKRAIVTQLGLGANLPEDAIYPINLADDTGKPLDGANRYVLHFESSTVPPVNAFWSVTLYDAEGYQVPNSLIRFAVSSWMPSNTTRTAPSTFISRTKAPAPTRKPTGCRPQKGRSTSRCVSMRQRAMRGPVSGTRRR